MNSHPLILKLDRATDRAISIALSRGIPLRVAKKTALIGNIVVRKNKKTMYDIVTLDGNTLFQNIYVFDVAVIVAQRYNAGETSVIKKVLSLEEKYSKYHTDMIHYLHCLKLAKKRNDTERMAILEDKFQISETMAKNIKDIISIFKRTK